MRRRSENYPWTQSTSRRGLQPSELVTLRWVWYLLLAYFVVATMAYRFAHPELTETQFLQRTPDALLWRWER